jgi:hypothetical protein
VARIVSLAQRVFHGLHQQVSDAALTMRHADVERHWRNAIARQGLPHKDLADHGTIAVSDDQFRAE